MKTSCSLVSFPWVTVQMTIPYSLKSTGENPVPLCLHGHPLASQWALTDGYEGNPVRQASIDIRPFRKHQRRACFGYRCRTPRLSGLQPRGSLVDPLFLIHIISYLSTLGKIQKKIFYLSFRGKMTIHKYRMKRLRSTRS